MERNQLIGFALIFVLLMLWTYINQPDPSAVETLSTTEESFTPHDVDSVVMDNNTARPPMDSAQLSDRYGNLVTLYSGVATEYTLSNNLVSIVLNSKGAKIKYAELANFDKIIKTSDGKESRVKVRLFEDEKNRFNFLIPVGSQTLSTEDIYFDAKTSNNKVSFIAQTPDNQTFTISYTLRQDSYVIDFDVKINGVRTASTQPLQLDLVNYLDQIEKNIQFEERFTTVYFKEKEEDADYCSCTSSSTEDLNNRPVEWVSFANQFFNTSIIASSKPFSGMIAATNMDEGSENDLKKTSALINMGELTGDTEFNLQIFAGPNEYKLLKTFQNDLEDIIPFGNSLFGDINRHLIRPFFDWLSTYIGSKGMVIIIMIFIIKMALYPLTYKMLHSQAKMGALKPRLADLKAKYKDDMQQQQLETMKIYREYGVSPFSGCLPMVAQMPIWYALFRFFPASITFRQEPFLWATDLSSFDEFIQLPFQIPTFGAHLSLFTLLWAVSTVVYTYYNMRHMDMSGNPAMKYVQYLMPVMFFVFFNNYASGLTCYMFFSNLFNIAQTVVTKYFVFDDEKILAQLDIQKAKPKKEGGFQSRLEAAMKQQQSIQEQRNKTKKKK